MRYFIAIASIIVFFACEDKNGETTRDQQTLDTTTVVQKGQEITSATFATLSSNLQKAMGEGGVRHALKFCNIKAYPLTDSLTEHFGVELRRASHRPRNPSSKADSLEMQSIEKYIEQIEGEKTPKARVIQAEDKILYHAPIRISNQLCLNCHGKPGEDITASNLQIIDSLYPDDEARDFQMGALRGIWSVRFPYDYFDSNKK